MYTNIIAPKKNGHHDEFVVVIIRKGEEGKDKSPLNICT
jgi:hypothetical protein